VRSIEMELSSIAQIFAATTTLQDAATQLKRLQVGEKLASDDRDVLRRAGTFLLQIDRSHPLDARPPMEANLSVDTSVAVEARPSFYASVLKLRDLLNDLGVDNREKFTRLFQNLYLTLTSGGTVRGDADEASAHLRVGVFLLTEMSEELLSQLETPDEVPSEPGPDSLSLSAR
jgi:hypothetical protein